MGFFGGLKDSVFCFCFRGCFGFLRRYLTVFFGDVWGGFQIYLEVFRNILDFWRELVRWRFRFFRGFSE